jgi:type II secretory pathway pseudopilin PulG
MPNKNKKNSKQAGFSTLEILIAFTLLILALSAVTLVAFGNQSLSIDSQTSEEALFKAQKQLEEARASARQNFFSLASSGAVSEDIYEKTLTVDWLDDYVKKITSLVTWKTDKLRDQKIELATIVTAPANSFRGDTCDPNLMGDWSDIQMLGHFDFSSSAGASDVDVRMHIVYLTSNPSAAGQEDFYVLNVTDPNNIIELSKINTGPGLEALAVAGNYAYVANTSINSQLQIIDISNSSNPLVLSSYKIPGVTGGVGKSIFFKDNKVYIGLTKATAGPEFNIIDVSNPLSPQYLGGWSAKTQVNAIFVRGGSAFLATPQPTPATPEKENLSVLDISNPSNIVRLNTYTTPDASTQDGESFFFDGNTLYFGRTVGGVDKKANHELFALDISDISNIKKLGSKNIASTVNAITLKGNLLFTLTSEPNKGFQIWDISNLANITLFNSENIEQTSTGGLDCEGNLIYVAQRSNRALQIIGPK